MCLPQAVQRVTPAPARILQRELRGARPVLALSLLFRLCSPSCLMPPTLKRKRSVDAESASGSDSDATGSGSGSEAPHDEHQDLDVPDAPSDPSSSHVLKPPTGQELKSIKEATDLYRSTSFKFQVRDTLLPSRRRILSGTLLLRSTPSSRTSVPSTNTPNPLTLSCLHSTNFLLMPPLLRLSTPFRRPALSPRRVLRSRTSGPYPLKTPTGRSHLSRPQRLFSLAAGLQRPQLRARIL